MKTMIQAVLLLVVVFAAAAGYQIYFASPKPAATNAGTDTAETEVAAQTAPVQRTPGSETIVSAYGNPQIPVAVAPRFTPGADEIESVARTLTDRAEVLDRRREALDRKEQAMNLILEDFRSEQELVSKLRAAVDAELEQATKDVVEQARQLDTGIGPAAGTTTNGPNGTRTAVGGSAEEQANLKKIGLVYDNMQPDAAAKIFIEMSQDGLEDTVVKLLAVMKDRQAAKVLGEIAATEAELAAELTEALRLLKTPATTPQAEPTPEN